jgi:hypothetical protein
MIRKAELKQQIDALSLQPTILSYADANHYLAGAEDSEGNFFSLSDDDRQPVIFNSIYEAETCLRRLGVRRAKLHLQTAYDEMIGHDESLL